MPPGASIAATTEPDPSVVIDMNDGELRTLADLRSVLNATVVPDFCGDA
jgi:hypothetical protein